MSRTLLAVLLVALLSAALRLSNIDHGLPCDPEPDLYTVRQVETLREDGLTDRYLAGWKYPLLFATVTAALPWEELSPPREAPLADHHAAAVQAHHWTRIVTAIIAALSAPLTVLFGLRFLSLGSATLAGLFVATSGMHVWMSFQARPHAPTVTVVLLALMACTRWIDRRRAIDALLAGLAVGAAGAALHSGLSAAIPWALAGLVVTRREGLRSLPWTVLSGALVLALVVWAYGLEPHEPRDWYVQEQSYIKAKEIAGTHFAFGGHLLRWDIFNGHGFSVLVQGLRLLDPVLGVATLLGIVALLASAFRSDAREGADRAAWLVTAGLFVPFMAVFGLYELSYWRFFLPVVPVFAIVAAAGIHRLGTTLGLSGRGQAALALAVLAFPLATSVRLAWLTHQTTTHERVGTLLKEKLEGGERSALLLMVRPLPYWAPKSVILATSPTSPNRWLRYQTKCLADWTQGLPEMVAAREVDPMQRLAILRAKSPEAAVAKALDTAPEDIVALSTTWHLAHDSSFRLPELDAWRNALNERGWRRTDVVAPLQTENAKGDIPKIELLSLFRRAALGDRYEIYERPPR